MPDDNLPTSKMDDNDKTRLISLAEAAELYGFNAQYLSQLAKRGRLKAQKIGGVWLTTKHDVETYIKSRKKRGAYRDDIQPPD
jgi:excisionase family DNA binding protein